MNTTLNFNKLLGYSANCESMFVTGIPLTSSEGFQFFLVAERNALVIIIVEYALEIIPIINARAKS